jgi:DNA-directed RNA polymerase subunit omega
MIYPSADQIDKQIDSKYALVVLAAKRAKQLKEGARPLIDTPSTNPLTIALEEIARGQLKYQFDETSLAGKEALEDEKAVVGYRSLADGEGADPLAMPDELRAAAAQLGADLTGADLDEDEEADTADEEEEEEPLLDPDEIEGTEA